MPRVAGIIVNVVPYHHARWEAFTRSSEAECHLLELTDRDAFKMLEYSATASYRRHTLSPRDGDEMISGTALRRAVTAKLDALQPEVVCVSGWALPVNLAALAWAARNRVPAVMLSESNEFDEGRSAVKEFFKRRIVALCSAGLAGGTPQANYLAKLGLPRDRISLGYDVVDNGYFADKVTEVRSQKLEVRKRFGLPENYFLACCRFGQKKNVPRLVEAFAQYRQLAKMEDGKWKMEGRAWRTDSAEREVGNTSPQPSPQSGDGDAPWDLVIVGDGELRGEIEATIARFGVGQSIHLAGAKNYSEIPTYYGLANAFIHASTTEQWGLVVNEAMASGLPVLVSNRCGCVADLVRDGVNGFTFDPRNLKELANLMLRISDLRFPIYVFGSESQRIIANWGPERFASGLKSAVDKALITGLKRAGLFNRSLLKVLLRCHRSN